MMHLLPLRGSEAMVPTPTAVSTAPPCFSASPHEPISSAVAMPGASVVLDPTTNRKSVLLDPSTGQTGDIELDPSTGRGSVIDASTGLPVAVSDPATGRMCAVFVDLASERVFMDPVGAPQSLGPGQAPRGSVV